MIHLLGHYAIHRRPPRLELVNISDFPGARRFTGLGELPPEALRMLWTTRKAVSAAQLQLGLDALARIGKPQSACPRGHHASDTPALPLLARALHRHLRELPSAFSGLSLTEELALTLMAEPRPLGRYRNLGNIYGAIRWDIDPLPGQGDLHVRDRVLNIEGASCAGFRAPCRRRPRRQA